LLLLRAAWRHQFTSDDAADWYGERSEDSTRHSLVTEARPYHHVHDSRHSPAGSTGAPGAGATSAVYSLPTDARPYDPDRQQQQQASTTASQRPSAVFNGTSFDHAHSTSYV